MMDLLENNNNVGLLNYDYRGQAEKLKRFLWTGQEEEKRSIKINDIRKALDYLREEREMSEELRLALSRVIVSTHIENLIEELVDKRLMESYIFGWKKDEEQF